MRVTTSALLAGLLCLSLPSCSDPDDGASTSAPTSSSTSSPTASVDDADRLLTQLWQHDLLTAPLVYGSGVAAVSQGHILATGSLDNSAGTTNPTPNVQLDYGIGDAETGEVVVMRPLAGGVSIVQTVPGTDLFVVVAGPRIGVIDPAQASFLWTRRRVGPEIVSLTSTRIFMGRVTPAGRDICLTVDEGEVRHGAACRAGQVDPQVVDGVRWSNGTQPLDLPDGTQVEVPATYAQDAKTFEPLWTYGSTTASFEGTGVGYETSTFAASSIGLVRVDYSRPVEEPRTDGQRVFPDAVLRLVDARTGEVTRTFGRVIAGTLAGFAGDVAIFEQPNGVSGLRAVAYRLTP